MNKPLKFSLLVSCVVLAACASEQHLSDDFGQTVRANQQAQIFNPNAAKGEAQAVMLDGQKAEQIIEGYRKEKGDVDTGRLVEDVGQ